MRVDFWCVGVAACLCAAAVPGPAAAAEDSLGSARAALDRWVQTQQLLSEEQKDWRLGREMLEKRIELLEGEIAEIESRLAETRQAISDTDAKRHGFASQDEKLGAAAASVGDVIVQLERKTKTLVATLPEPLRERVAPLAQRIPDDAATSRRSIGERFQNVLGILNEVNKFNGDVSVTTEVRALPDGRTAEVSALYVGLGQAYYVTRDGDAAGVGRPAADGWTWTAANDLAPAITQAIAILRNEKVPAFVPLPVEIGKTR